MTRIDAKFADLKAQGKKAFVAYVMAGDPDYDSSLELVKGLPGAGVDVIELGLPFTDPMADGPTIQLAGQRALEGGMTLQKTLQMARAFREAVSGYASLRIPQPRGIIIAARQNRLSIRRECPFAPPRS